MASRGDRRSGHYRMKILIDMNLSPAWVSVLQEAGHTASHWSHIGSLNAPDREVLLWAKANGYLLCSPMTLTSEQSLLLPKRKDQASSKSGHKTSRLTTQRLRSSTSSVSFQKIFFRVP